MKNILLVLYVAVALSSLATMVLAPPAFTAHAAQNNNTQYNPNANYGIQVTIQDAGNPANISAANITTNITGTLASYLRNANGIANWSTFNNTTAGIWYINFTGSQIGGANNYTYTWWSNNTANGATTDVTKPFIIQKNTSNPVNVLLNGSATNQTYTYPSVVGISATGMNGGSGLFYRNGTNTTDTPALVLGVAVHEIKANTSGNQNYSANSTGSTLYATVSKGTPSLGISISPSSSVTAGATVTVSCSATVYSESTSPTLTLSRDGVAVSNPEQTSFSSARTVSYSCSSSETANYTTTSTSATLTVSGGGLIKPRTFVTEVPGGVQITIPQIAADSMAKVDIEKSEQPLRSIEISVTNKVISVSLKIVKLADNPTALENPTDKIYQFIEITKGNIRDQDISSSKLRFAVPKSWLNDNSVGNVALYRVENGKWTKYSANKVSDTADENIYEATTAGLSVFSIGADTLAIPTTIPGAPSGNLLVYTIAALALIGGAVYFFFLKK